MHIACHLTLAQVQTLYAFLAPNGVMLSSRIS